MVTIANPIGVRWVINPIESSPVTQTQFVDVKSASTPMCHLPSMLAKGIDSNNAPSSTVMANTPTKSCCGCSDFLDLLRISKAVNGYFVLADNVFKSKFIFDSPTIPYKEFSNSSCM